MLNSTIVLGSGFAARLRAVSLFVATLALGCSGRSRSSDGDSVAAVGQAVTAPLAADQARILGFENIADWTVSSGAASLAGSPDHAEGSASLKASGVTNVTLKSASFAPFAGGFSSVSIWVKNSAANASVTGTVSLSMNSSAPAGLPTNGFIGQASLQGPSSNFQLYTFAVPPWLNDTIAHQAGSAVFMTVTLTFSQASNCQLDAIVPSGSANNREAPPAGFQSVDPASAIFPSASLGQDAAGRIAGSSAVDAAGAFSYHMPIEVPPGRAGMEPHLALAYSSAAGNGALGVGWSVEGLSTIARCRQVLARDGVADSIKVKLKADHCSPGGDCREQFPQYTAGLDNFCLDGEKLVWVGGTPTSPEFRTERDSQAKVVATYDGANWPSKFTVWRRDGNIATYPAGPAVTGVDSRNVTSGAPIGTPFQGVISWPIGTLQDRFGNGVSYKWRAGDTGSAAQLPDTITYTTCAAGFPCLYGTAAERQINFVYTVPGGSNARTDYLSRWVAGLNAGVGLRLARIEELNRDADGLNLVRSYAFGYDTSAATERSRLTSVLLCDGQGACLPSTQFEWGNNQGQGFRRRWHVLGPDPVGTVSAGECVVNNPAPGCFFAKHEQLDLQAGGDAIAPRDQFLVGDFDGNGTDDIIILDGDLTETNPAHPPNAVLWLSHAVNNIVTFERIQLRSGSGNAPSRGPNYELSMALDVDQDGQTEVLIGTIDGKNIKGYQAYRYNSIIRDFAPVLRDDGTQFGFDSPVVVAQIDKPTLVDVSGDGLLDYFYDSHALKADGHGHVYYVSRAIPGASTLMPQAYTSALPVDYSPSDTQGGVYNQGLCALQPVDYAGHGYNSPALVCNGTAQTTFFRDLNGDGLADFLTINRGSGAAVTARLSTGVEVSSDLNHMGLSQVAPEKQALPETTLALGEFTSSLGSSFVALPNQLADFDGDGLVDIAQFATHAETQAPVLWLGRNVDATRTRLAAIQIPYTQQRFSGIRHVVGDFNGDGLADIVQPVQFRWVGSGDDVHAVINLQFLIQDSSNRDDLITRVTSDSVELAKLVYTSGPTAAISPDGSVAGPMQGVFAPRRGLTVVTRASLVQGNARDERAYFYTRPAVDTSGRGFLGFASLVTADLRRSMKTTTLYENTRMEGTLLGYHVFPYAMTPSEVDVTSGSDALSGLNTGPNLSVSEVTEKRSQQTTVRHQAHPLNTSTGTLSPTSTFFVETSSTATTKKDASGAVVYAGTSANTKYDDFGDVTDATTLDGSDQTTVHATYVNDTANWFVSRPLVSSTTHTVLGFVGPVNSQTETAHLLTNWYGYKGELNGVTDMPNGGATQLFTNYWRDGAGLVKSAISYDSFGNVRANTYEYSADGVYPEHIQDALGHDTWVAHHSGLGVPLVSFDNNGNKTLYTYDGFGRSLSVTPTRAPVTTTSYTQAAGALRISVTQSPGTNVLQQYDELGNLLASGTHIGGRESAVQYTYDPLGRVHTQGAPFFDDGANPGGTTTYTYNNLGEVHTATLGDGSVVTIDHSNPLVTDVTTTGDQIKHTVVTKMNDGRVVSVRETSLTGGVTTRGVDYLYGQNKQISQVTELGGPTTTYYTYGLPYPAVVVDSERGVLTMTHDAFGQLRSVVGTGSNPIVRNYEYDNLGRPTRIVTRDPDPVTPTNTLSGETRYVYDQGLGAIGKLSYASSPDGVATRYAYTPEGLPATVEYDSAFGNFVTGYGFDPNGRLKHIDYPDAGNGLPRLGIDLNYNDFGGALADGSLQSVTRPTGNFWQALRRGPTGMAEDTIQAGNLTQSIAIDGHSRRVTGITVRRGQSPLYDVQYEYFPGGNLRTRTDNLTSAVDRYTFDGFDQLATWSSSGAATTSETYGYDALGNQTTSGTVTEVFGGTGFSPHQLASRTAGSETRTFSYDSLGRQTSMKLNGALSRSIAYTPFDLPSKVTTTLPTAQTVNYRYDSAQHKFSEDSNTSSTVYVGDLYERRLNKSTCIVDDVFYVYAEGQRVAQIVQEHHAPSCGGTAQSAPAVESVYVLHSDLHGSVTAATNIGGSGIPNRQAFSPWGERLAPSPGVTTSIANVTVGFTDQEQDDNVGLVNMRGRMYDATTRTFLTPDPITSSPFKVTGWNKYAYVRNNPLKFVDPSGFAGEPDEAVVMPPLVVVPETPEVPAPVEDFAAPEFAPGFSGDSFDPPSLSPTPDGDAGPSTEGAGGGSSREPRGTGGTGPQAVPEPRGPSCFGSCGDKIGPLGGAVIELLGPARSVTAGAATTELLTELRATDSGAELLEVAEGAERARLPDWQYGDTHGALGTTDKFGNVTIQPGLTGQTLRETVRHESVHSFLSPRAPGALQTTRANLGQWAYNNSSLARYFEEGLAEGYATGSVSTGVTYPLAAGYVSLGGVAVEGTLYFGGIGGAIYLGATQ